MAASALGISVHKNNNHFLDHRPNYKSKIFISNLVLVLVVVVVVACSLLEVVNTQSISIDSPYYYIGCYTERTDLLKEAVYSKTPQTCVEICEYQSFSYAILSAERCFCSNSVNGDEQQDERLCTTRCLADKSQYCGGIGVHSYYTTRLAKEMALQDLRVINATENSLTLSWRPHIPPKMLVGGAEALPKKQITNFLIKSNILHTYATLPYFSQPEFIVQNTESRFEITDLHAASSYNITVDALCEEGVVCGSETVIGTTLVGEPSPEPSLPYILNTTDKTITITIPPIRNDNGPVTKVLIIVNRVDPALDQFFDKEQLGSWEKAKEDGLPYYIAAELDYQQPEENRTRKFIVGDDQTYGPYRNVPLENAKNADIHISLGVVSTLNGITRTLYTRATHQQHTMTLDNFQYSTFDSGNESIIALTVTCVIFGTCLLLSVMTYFYLRYKTCRNRGGLRNTHEMTLQQPIIERENNGFIVEDEPPTTTENFKQQLNMLVDSLDASKRLPRNALRMNINDILAEGRYGEVITGKLLQSEQNIDCQLHVVSLDELASVDQARLLQEFRNVTRLQPHMHIMDFYGISASADWFYFIFEYQQMSLKRRLVESRRVPNSAPIQRLTTLSEELVLQWIYELACAGEYMSKCKVVHRQFCAHNVYVTPESQLKVSVFGPVLNSNQCKVDLTRWLAPETLRFHNYSLKSDIWSFGCVAWECCSLGGTPYANINNNDHLLDAIKSGSRPAQPAYVYQDLYQLLLNCWQLEPSERINFEDIAFNVRQLMTSPRHALCFDRQSETRVPNENNVLDMLPFYMPLLETSHT